MKHSVSCKINGRSNNQSPRFFKLTISLSCPQESVTYSETKEIHSTQSPHFSLICCLILSSDLRKVLEVTCFLQVSEING